MSTGTKLVAFAAVLAAAFGGALAVGAAAGPIDVGGGTDHGGLTSTGPVSPDAPPRGLAIAAGGYRLAIESDELAPGTPSTFAFEILDSHGAATTRFVELHERRLHLIVLSRNLVDYLHLHPEMDTTGRWTVTMPPLQPGSYRVFADFQADGADNLTLGADLSVAGDVQTIAIPVPSTSARVDGYDVSLSGAPQTGDSELTFSVSLNGREIRTEPYLGASGHLVAIRAGDLAYLHVHPHDEPTAAVTFTGEFPTAGTYRLFFDFAHDGAVHTAAFTVDVPDDADRAAPEASPSHDEGH